MNIIERDTGEFPLSIGTSLAIEGLLGIHPDKPRAPRGADNINRLYINIETLIRNCVAAMTNEAARQASVDGLVDVVGAEMQTLPQILQDTRPGVFEVIYYFEDPETPKWLFPQATFKTPTTERQHYYATLTDAVVNHLMAWAEHEQIPIEIYATRKKPQYGGSVALLTHFPHQLLWNYQFGALWLLESHTGKLKGNALWASKLSGVKADDFLPFNAFLLQIFGDGVVVQGQSRRMKDEVKALAKRHRWTTTTTMEKIRSNLLQDGTPELSRLHRELMR